MTAETHSQLANFIWSICNLLRGPYKRNEYRKVILPLTVLRRFDCLLAPTKAAVLEEYPSIKKKPETVVRSLLQKITKRPFYNLSKLDFKKLLDDPNQLAPNLNSYINKFSANVRDIVDRFGFDEHIARMAEKNLLYEVIKAFAKIDLSSSHIDNVQMGYVFEELIRIGAEQANEEAGEHFTPREVIKLMVNLLLSPEKDLTHSHVVKTIYDPACGTGGMLSVSENYIHELNSDAKPMLYGQDWNDDAWAVCKSDMLIKGEDADNIILGDTFSKDGFPDDKFDYMLANPPFGVEWKQQQRFIEQERDSLGFQGRFGAGTAARERWLASFSSAHAFEDARPEERRQPHRHRLQRLASLHRRRRQRRIGNPPLDHRERLAGSDRRPARPALLQHRHLHLPLDSDQSESETASRQDSIDRRAQLLDSDEEEPWQQAPQDRRWRSGRARRHRRDHAHLRQFHRWRNAQAKR